MCLFLRQSCQEIKHIYCLSTQTVLLLCPSLQITVSSVPSEAFIFIPASVYLDCAVHLGGRKRSKADGGPRVLHRGGRRLCDHVYNLPAQLCTCTLLTFTSLHLGDILVIVGFVCSGVVWGTYLQCITHSTSWSARPQYWEAPTD